MRLWNPESSILFVGIQNQFYLCQVFIITNPILLCSEEKTCSLYLFIHLISFIYIYIDIVIGQCYDFLRFAEACLHSALYWYHCIRMHLQEQLLNGDSSMFHCLTTTQHTEGILTRTKKHIGT